MPLLRKPLLWILLLGAILRFWGIASESLWLDEGHTVEKIGKPWHQLASDWTQGPVFLALEKIFCSVAGTSELALRFLPAFFGVFAIYVCWLLGRQLWHERAGLAAALLVTVNPYAVFYAQDARPYSLYFLLSSLLLYLTLRWASGESRLRTYWILCAILLFYTHPFAVFVLAAVVSVFFLETSRNREEPGKSLRAFTITFGIVLTAMLPQIWRVFKENFLAGGFTFKGSWIASVDVWTLPFTAARWSGTSVDAVKLLSFLAIVFFAIVLYQNRAEHRWRPWIYLSIWTACILLLPLIVSMTLKPVYVLRYVFPAQLAWLLLWAGLAAHLHRYLGSLLVLLILALGLPSLYSMSTGVDKDPWREAAAMLENRLQPSDALIIHPGFQQIALEYYLDFPESVTAIKTHRKDLLDYPLPGSSIIWWIEGYEANWAGPAERLRAEIERAYTLEQVISVKDSVNTNPRAEWIAPIRLLRFEKRES